MPIEAVQQFPRGFLWGTATAAHQVEGDNVNDWSRWEQGKGHVYADLPSGRACEWWAGRYEEDFDRAAAMHNNAHRLSVEWSRIEPERDRWDDAALDRYREMLKALRARSIEPMITLHHFTNPLWIADEGEWSVESVIARFERYVRHTVEALQDLCTLWCTINEPMVYATQGYSFGAWPPGSQSRRGVTQVTINLLKAHAAAYHAIKSIQPEAQVGYSTHQLGIEPAAPALINRYAARLVESYFNRAFVLALRDGVVRMAGSKPIPLPQVKGTLDWIGVQYYQQFRVGFDLRSPSSFFLRQSKPTNLPVGPGSWGGIYPEALFNHIKWFDKVLHKPIYITECGVPDPDDTLRPGYLIKSVRAAWRAVNFNFPVRGFFFWTLLDNFEWDKGYDPRFNFGLYKTDFETQERTPRPSARLYSAICAQNGLSAETVRQFAPDLLDELFPGTQAADNVKLRPPQMIATPALSDKRSSST